MRRLLIALALLGTACGPASSVVEPRFPEYRYTIAIPTAPVAPDEELHLVWEPRLALGLATEVSTIELCVALFGPWESVDALKRAMSAAATGPSCPPKGAARSSDTMRTMSNSGARLATDLVIPSAIGFYDVRQIAITIGSGGSASAMAAGGIIEVRNRYRRELSLGPRPPARVDGAARVRRRPAPHGLLPAAAIGAPGLAGQRISLPLLDERVDAREQYGDQRSRDRAPQREREEAEAPA
jgi:hypothetical protein